MRRLLALILGTTLCCAASGALSAPAASTPVRYAAPLTGPLDVTRGFSPPASAYGAGHRGVDLAAPAGAPVLAAGPGRVVFAGPVDQVLAASVQHADGVRTTYEPLAAVAVRVGQLVQAGDRLGSLAAGHPGCVAPRPLVCLHWGALLAGRPGPPTYLDPLLLLERTRVRLLTPLPWADSAGGGALYLGGLGPVGAGARHLAPALAAADAGRAGRAGRAARSASSASSAVEPQRGWPSSAKTATAAVCRGSPAGSRWQIQFASLVAIRA